MRKIFLFAVIFPAITMAGFSQGKKDMKPDPNWFSGGFQLMQSTHRNYFMGPLAEDHMTMSEKFAVGIGASFSYTPHHTDNGWRINHLLFGPIYLDQWVEPYTEGLRRIYFHLSEGISFNHYRDKEAESTPDEFRFANTSFYGYVGSGYKFSINKTLSSFTEAGLSSFNITANNLDINPHGFTVKSGVAVSIY